MTMSYNLLVLGPMQHRVGDDVIRESNTKRVGEILDQMSRALAIGGEKPFRVVTPGSTNDTSIVELVMGEIEQADLVVLDLSGNRPTRRHEAGGIHSPGHPQRFATRGRYTSAHFPAV